MNHPLIVINNAMQKSASTLLHLYTRMLIDTVFPDNGQRALMEATHSGKIAGGWRQYVRTIDDRTLDIILEIASSEGPVVVKTHCDTTPKLLDALRDGRIRMTFNIRDPRDVILSAMDFRTLSKDEMRSPAIRKCTSVPNSLDLAQSGAQKACNWLRSGLTHLIRYTDLVSTPARELRRLVDYLGIPAGAEVVETVIKAELAQRQHGKMQFNRGELHRYGREMSPDDLALCNRELGELITSLGYEM